MTMSHSKLMVSLMITTLLVGTRAASDVLYRSAQGSVSQHYDQDCHTIPNDSAYLKLVMGNVVDYFKPTSGNSYCDMLQSSTKHLWSADGINWQQPEYFRHGLGSSYGGSASMWPADGRRYLSFWGGHSGGCCAVNYDMNGAWRRDFELYYAPADANAPTSYSCFDTLPLGGATCSHTGPQTFNCNVGAGSERTDDYRYMHVPETVMGDFEVTWKSTITEHTVNYYHYGTLLSAVDDHGNDCFRLTTRVIASGTCDDTNEHVWSIAREGSQYSLKCDNVVQPLGNMVLTCDNRIVEFVIGSHLSGKFCRVKGTFSDLMVTIPSPSDFSIGTGGSCPSGYSPYNADTVEKCEAAAVSAGFNLDNTGSNHEFHWGKHAHADTVTTSQSYSVCAARQTGSWAGVTWSPHGGLTGPFVFDPVCVSDGAEPTLMPTSRPTDFTPCTTCWGFGMLAQMDGVTDATKDAACAAFAVQMGYSATLVKSCEIQPGNWVHMSGGPTGRRLLTDKLQILAIEIEVDDRTTAIAALNDPTLLSRVNVALDPVGISATNVALPVSDAIPCQVGWEYFEGHCYFYEPFQRNWADQEDFCVSWDAHLASIHSDAENDFVHSLPVTVNSLVWIGVAPGTAFTWRGGFENATWSDMTPNDYENFLPGQPNSPNEECVHMISSGGWNDLTCSTPQGAVCKKIAATSTTSTAPSSVPTSMPIDMPSLSPVAAPDCAIQGSEWWDTAAVSSWVFARSALECQQLCQNIVECAYFVLVESDGTCHFIGNTGIFQSNHITRDRKYITGPRDCHTVAPSMIPSQSPTPVDFAPYSISGGPVMGMGWANDASEWNLDLFDSRCPFGSKFVQTEPECREFFALCQKSGTCGNRFNPIMNQGGLRQGCYLRGDMVFYQPRRAVNNKWGWFKFNQKQNENFQRLNYELVCTSDSQATEEPTAKPTEAKPCTTCFQFGMMVRVVGVTEATKHNACATLATEMGYDVSMIRSCEIRDGDYVKMQGSGAGRRFLEELKTLQLELEIEDEERAKEALNDPNFLTRVNEVLSVLGIEASEVGTPANVTQDSESDSKGIPLWAVLLTAGLAILAFGVLMGLCVFQRLNSKQVDLELGEKRVPGYGESK